MISTDVFANTFGVVPAGDDEKMVKIAVLAVRNGFAVVLNKPGSKIPACTLTVRTAKEADRAAQEEARAAGDPHWARRRHACGIHHAFTDAAAVAKTARRLVKNLGRINLGVEPGRSRMAVVDVDTTAEKDAFLAWWTSVTGRDMTAMPPTVRSPGSKDPSGRWVHSGGGHYWFHVPEGEELPTGGGVLKGEGGWSVMWRDKQVLVPPSSRSEGAYSLTGQAVRLPDALADFIRTGAARQASRRATAVLAVRTGDSLAAWAADKPWAEILQPDGWTDTGKADNCGCPVWTAPGDHASPKSATAHEPGCGLYTTDGGQAPIHIWTDSVPECAAEAVTALGKTFSKVNYLRFRLYDGDMARTKAGLGITGGAGGITGGAGGITDGLAAAKEALGQTVTAPVPGDDGNDDGDGEYRGDLCEDFGLPSGDGAGGKPAPPARVTTLLPEAFWNARPELAHIRQAAWSRDVAPDVVLYAVLVRISSFLPGDLKVDTGIGDRRSLNLNLFAALVGGPSDGKTSSAGLAPYLVPVPPVLRPGFMGEIHYHDEAPIGTGEGLIEAFMGMADITVDDRTVQRRRQIRHNASFYVDEGKTITSLMIHREGSTLGQTIRTAWYGKKIGQMNATADRTRLVEDYALGLLIGYQPETALPLLEGADEGTPQRFMWARADLTGNPEETPDDPGPLWDPETLPKILGMDPAHGSSEDGGYLLGDRSETAVVLAPELKARIRADRRAARKERPGLLDGHRPTSLIKLSGLLAVLAGRTEITEDDWTLALIMWGVSCAIRSALVAWADGDRKKKAEERTKTRVEEAVAVREAVTRSSDTVVRVARRLHRIIVRKGGMTPGALKKDLGRDKPVFGDAYGHAMAQGWLCEEDGTVIAGELSPDGGT